MKLKDMNSLLVHEIKDLMSAEKQLTKALPKMAKAATHPKLREAIESHLMETEAQLARLEDICKDLGIAPRSEHCAGMEGLIKEGTDVLEQEGADPAVKDAAIIAAAQRVEHYEIAAYGSARAFAEQLKLDKIAKTLQKTLDEEGAADKKLTSIAESIVNANAAKVAQ